MLIIVHILSCTYNRSRTRFRVTGRKAGSSVTSWDVTSKEKPIITDTADGGTTFSLNQSKIIFFGVVKFLTANGVWKNNFALWGAWLLHFSCSITHFLLSICVLKPIHNTEFHVISNDVGPLLLSFTFPTKFNTRR